MGQLTWAKKLQGSALIETIVALVIILVIFGIVTSFLAQAGSSSFSLQKLKAIQLLNKYAEETGENKAFVEEEISINDVYLRRQMALGEIKEPAVNMRFSVYDKDHKLIVSQQRLFYSK